MWAALGLLAATARVGALVLPSTKLGALPSTKLSALPSTQLGALVSPSPQLGALREWLVPHCEQLPDEIRIDDDGIFAVRAFKRGDVILAVSDAVPLTAQAAYNDKDVGPKLRDLAARCGPGFSSVALAGLVAAERVRSYRATTNRREMVGDVVPSQWGALVRSLWAQYDAAPPQAVSADVAATVDMGVGILVPLLDVTARRSFNGPPPTAAKFLASEAWALAAMADDDAQAWSRSQIVDVASAAFSLVLDWQRPPLPRLLDDADGGEDEPPAVWSEASNERLALLPLVDRLVTDGPHNARLGSPPKTKYGNRGVGQALWVQATSDIEPGDAIRAPYPWPR